MEVFLLEGSKKMAEDVQKNGHFLSQVFSYFSHSNCKLQKLQWQDNNFVTQKKWISLPAWNL